MRVCVGLGCPASRSVAGQSLGSRYSWFCSLQTNKRQRNVTDVLLCYLPLSSAVTVDLTSFHIHPVFRWAGTIQALRQRA